MFHHQQRFRINNASYLSRFYSVKQQIFSSHNEKNIYTLSINQFILKILDKRIDFLRIQTEKQRFFSIIKKFFKSVLEKLMERKMENQQLTLYPPEGFFTF
jgi:hypothetical protein